MASNSAKTSDVEVLDRNCLLDGFLTLYEECSHTNLLKIKNVSSFVKKYNKAVNQTKKDKKKAFDFEVKAIIGRGHFGEVRVVREKDSGAVYAMKVLRKSDLLSQSEVSCFEEERDIMACSTSPWVTQLHYAFQDSVNLYLVMDFHAGGDLLSLLSRHDDIFEEKMAKFYIAEIAVAINSLHQMGYLHRDIKPENILLDCTGHIKLADFGSAAKLDEHNKVSSHMLVGTPEYVAPELLQSMNKFREKMMTYGPEVDWWSLGVCAYEMLYGDTPFSNEPGSMVTTYANIMRFKHTLTFPSESDVSDEAKDLIKKLLTDSQERLSWDGIKSHPFFKGINWDTIREGEAFYVPSIHGLDDTSHFDEVEKVQHQPDIEALKTQHDFSGRDLPFIGFTFSKVTDNEGSASDRLNNSNSLRNALVLGDDVAKILTEKDREIKKLRHLLNSYEMNETKCESLVETWNALGHEMRQLEHELLDVKMEEMKSEIVLLQSEQEKLSTLLRDKDYQLSKTQEALNEANSQLEAQRKNLDKEKRKSRDGHHKDLVLLEMNNETWESLLQEKQAVIEQLSAKLSELEKLVEAYEESEEQQASEVQQLQHKMNTSLHDLSTSVALADIRVSGGGGEAKLELDNFHHSLCPSKKKLTLHVTLKTGRCSFLDNQNVSKLQALQKMVDKYADNAREWHEKEEQMNNKLTSLETEVQTLRQKEGMGRKMKDNLMEKVSCYQHEVEAQKTIIKELQETMRNYLTKSTSCSDSDKKMKEMQQSKLDLETELIQLKGEVEKSRQAALLKTKQMEDAIQKLEEQRLLALDYKNKYDCQVELTEAKVRSLEDELAKVTADRQRFERREATLVTQLAALKAEKEGVEQKGDKEKIVLYRLREEKDKAVAERNNLEKQKETLEKELSDLRKEKYLSEKELSDLRKEKYLAEKELNDLKKEKDASDESVKKLNREIDRLESSLGKLQEQCKTVEGSEVNKLSLEINRLKKLVDRLENEKVGQEVRSSVELGGSLISRLHRENADLRKQVENLEKQVGKNSPQNPYSRRTSLAKLQESGSLQKSRQENENKVKALEKEIVELKLKLNTQENDSKVKTKNEKLADESKVKIKGFEEEVVSLQNELKEKKKGAEEMQSKLDVQTSNVTKLRSEVKALEKEIVELKSKLNKQENDSKVIAKNEQLADESKVKIKELEEEVVSLQNELKEKKKKAEEMQSKLDVQTSNVAEQRAQVKALEKEIVELKSKLNKQEKDSKNEMLAEEMKVKIKGLEDEVVSLQNKLIEKKKVAEETQSRLDVQTENVAELRAEIEELMKNENDLVTQLEKEALRAKHATEEKEKLVVQIKKLESQPSKMSGEMKFEKVQLEGKVQELTSERDALQVQLDAIVKSDVTALASQVTDLQQQLEEARREIDIRRGASEFSGGDIPAYLRHELEESNLALSEARSLLAASKRQELELRDRIDRLQRILDNKAVENATYLQNAQDALAELKTLKSQHDTLQRQYKVLEDKHASLQKERGSSSKETVNLMDEVKSKQQQYEMGLKKVEQLTKVCTELEEQVKDLEHIVEESRKREAEWDNIKKTYEKAVGERDDELDGATQQLQAVAMARSAASEKMTSMKQQMESMKALHKAEIEKLSYGLREEKATVAKLMQKLSEANEKDSSTRQVCDSQAKELDRFHQEKLKLKEELAEVLNDNCSIRKENLKLKKHLDEAINKFEMIIGEKVSLENFAEVLQRLHFLDKFKFESTIGQQMKLIDYLQDLYLEHSGKKKKSKFFGSKSASKDGQKLPMSWTDLQTALDQERSKSAIMLEQMDKLREENFQQANELLKWKQPGKVQANVTVKLTNSALNALANPPNSRSSELSEAHSSSSLASSGSSSTSRSHYSRGKSPHTPHNQRKALQHTYRVPEAFPTPQRMLHNIPHRFVTGLNTRTTKCGLCLGTVYFVRQASKCQECSLVVHPKCAVSVPATCGLPTEYVRHFALMMNQIYRDTDQNAEVDTSCVKMAGWLKIPRVGKSGWENRYCVLEGTLLTLFMDENDGNPVDSFDLDPMDADVSIHSAVTSAELANTASTDLHYVLRLDQDPLTTCWPGRYLYLMTTNFQEKQRWVASLEAVVKSAQCKSELYRNNSQTLTVLSLKDAECRDFNCTLALSNQLVLVGTDDGLYAFNPHAMTSKRKQMTQLTGFGSVHQMILAKGVDLILVLTGPERRLIMLENKLVKCRMSQTLGGETTPFSFKTIDGLQSCTIFDVGLWNNASYLVVGTPTKLYVMKYNPSLAMYCVRKEFPSSEPCSCVCIADNYAIVGTERFYKINLEHPSLLDFVDRQDSSLAFAAYGAANHHSYPLAVVRVSADNTPLEFLLCFHEFGVFVDHHGQRSRATDVKWSGLPLAFAFVEPFLYVTYTSTVHATVIPTDKSRVKGRQTVIDLQSPRYLGPAPDPGCVYIGSSGSTSSNVTEVISIRGQEDFSTDSDKENLNVMKTPSKKVALDSPRKTPKFHQNYNKGSLASVYSNSSSSTYNSVESDV